MCVPKKHQIEKELLLTLGHTTTFTKTSIYSNTSKCAIIFAFK